MSRVFHTSSPPQIMGDEGCVKPGGHTTQTSSLLVVTGLSDTVTPTWDSYAVPLTDFADACRNQLKMKAPKK